MPIEFRCTECGRPLQAGDAASGTRILCPGCGVFSAVPSVDAPGSPFAPGGEPVAGEDAENPYRAPAEYSPPRVSTGSTDPKAVASLVLGLCGFTLFCFCGPLSLPVAVIGLVLGIMGRNSESRGLAVAGIVLCAVQLALAAVGVVLMIFFVIAGA